MNISIIGGGTAGWLSALHLNKINPTADISLIESKDIGIVGVGEGAVPLFGEMLSDLNIDVIDFVNSVDGTFKLGISFEGWKNLDHKFLYGFPNFYSNDVANFEKTKFGSQKYDIYPIFANMIANSQDCNIMQNSILGYLNKVPFTFNEESKNGITQDGISHVSFHFDAYKAAHYFRKTAESRGIKRIEGKVIDFKSSKDQNIKSIITEDKKEYKCDFVFDCTGFAKLIIGKHFKSKWTSYKKHLTTNEVISFRLKYKENEEVFPYTKSITMKNGWMWQIPLQSRIGAGYVYDNRYITKSQAKEEVEEFLGEEIEILKKINFEPGIFEKGWIKNCVSIGLSSAFVEPLESTSIMFTILQLRFFKSKDLLEPNEFLQKKYNEHQTKSFKSIIDLIQLHYLCDRNDTKFWKDRKKLPITTPLQKRLNNFKKYPLSDSTFFDGVWGALGFFVVGYESSVKNFPKKLYQFYNKKHNFDKLLKDWIKDYKQYFDNTLPKYFKHKDLLDYLKTLKS